MPEGLGTWHGRDEECSAFPEGDRDRHCHSGKAGGDKNSTESGGENQGTWPHRVTRTVKQITLQTT